MSSSLATVLQIIAALALLLGGTAIVIASLLGNRKFLTERIERIRSGLRMTQASAPLREQAISSLFTVLNNWCWTAGHRQQLSRIFFDYGVRAEPGIAVATSARIGITLVGAGAFPLYAILSGSAMSAPLAIALGAGCAAAGWYAPRFVLHFLESKRMAAIERGLPEVVELLVICAEAGLSLDAGLDRTVIELRRTQPDLAHEFMITLADLKILQDRDLALAKLAERIPMPGVHAVVTTLSQTMRYGTPLAKALRSVATELRDTALSRLEERANRLPVILTVPVVVFILPALFLIVGGPALLRIADLFHQ